MLGVPGRDSVFFFNFLDFEISLWEGNGEFMFIRLEVMLESGLIEAVGLVIAEGLEGFGFLMGVVFGMV